MEITKGKEGLETQQGIRMGIEKCVLDQNLLGFRHQEHLSGEDHPSYPINQVRSFGGVKLPHIFMTLGNIMIPFIFVNSQIEFLFVLNYCGIQGG